MGLPKAEVLTVYKEPDFGKSGYIVYIPSGWKVKKIKINEPNESVDPLHFRPSVGIELEEV